MAGAFDYEVFGLNIRSEIPLPELFESRGTHAPDVFIRQASIRTVASNAEIDVDEGALVLSIPEVARYRIERGREILVDPESGVPERNVRLFLLGSAFGALLHQRGLLPLHANAVEIDGRAVAFMGESGAGKSTLAAWFHRRGYRIIADDVCVVGFDDQGEPFAAPGLPRLRLWSEALELMGHDPRGLNRSYLSDEHEKFDVPMNAASVARSQMPLAAIYLLDQGGERFIVPLCGIEATDAIFANTYRGEYLAKTSGQKEHWESAVRLVRGTPVFRVSREWDLAVLDQQCGQILDHVSSRGTPDRASLTVAEPVESGSICVGCGLCCDGTLHGSTKVRQHDEGKVLAAPLEIITEGERRFFRQPCPHFSSGSCSIYSERPGVCRTYSCALLGKLQGGQISAAGAREKIATAHDLVATVRALDPNAITPAQRTALSKRLKSGLTGAVGEDRDDLARQLLRIGVLEHFLARWFLKESQGEKRRKLSETRARNGRSGAAVRLLVNESEHPGCKRSDD